MWQVIFIVFRCVVLTSPAVSSVSNSDVLIDIVTHRGVSCRLRRERYFFQAEALRLISVQGDDSCWQFLAPLPLSPHQVKSPPTPPRRLPLSRCLQPSVSRPVSPRHVSLSHVPPRPLSPPSDSVSHYLSPGARCSFSVSMGAIFPLVLSGPLLHCQCYYINRKQWSGYSATHSAPTPSPPPPTPRLQCPAAECIMLFTAHQAALCLFINSCVKRNTLSNIVWIISSRLLFFYKTADYLQPFPDRQKNNLISCNNIFFSLSLGRIQWFIWFVEIQNIVSHQWVKLNEKLGASRLVHSWSLESHAATWMLMLFHCYAVVQIMCFFFFLFGNLLHFGRT